MKKLRITVNEKVYEVQVEVLEDDEQHVPGALQSAPMPVALHRNGNGNGNGGHGGSQHPPPIAPHPPAAARGVDPNKVLAPIAGTVQKIFAERGKHVEAKAPMVLLDAMKMDMYIYAPRAGTIDEVGVKVGDAVQVGECLLRYAAEE